MGNSHEFEKYQAMANYKPVMDKKYPDIPNKYWNIFNFCDENHLLHEYDFNPSRYMSVREVYRINGTVPVELVLQPSVDFSWHYLSLALNNDYANFTFIAKSKKSFKLRVYEFDEFFNIRIFENNFEGIETEIQHIIISKKSYNLTFLLPFNLK